MSAQIRIGPGNKAAALCGPPAGRLPFHRRRLWRFQPHSEKRLAISTQTLPPSGRVEASRLHLCSRGASGAGGEAHAAGLCPAVAS